MLLRKEGTIASTLAGLEFGIEDNGEILIKKVA